MTYIDRDSFHFLVENRQSMKNCRDVIVLISANAEWKVVREFYEVWETQKSSWGDFFELEFHIKGGTIPIIFFHGGWGKICAAASTQYVIDRWQPKVIINVGTCGGFQGKVERETIILAEKTIVYDLIEKMENNDEAIRFYTTDLDLSWLGVDYPITVKKTLLVSGDRDLLPDEISFLEKQYGAIAGDWESGAIAFTCSKNNVKCLILRGVTDLVNELEGEAYQNFKFFEFYTHKVMEHLLISLPLWLERFPIF